MRRMTTTMMTQMMMLLRFFLGDAHILVVEGILFVWLGLKVLFIVERIDRGAVFGLLANGLLRGSIGSVLVNVVASETRLR
ncbi:exo-beta--glucanase [Moniliophthora roreri]|nr:exo-beta--glucanase [Moniliophthora roreri]